MERTPLSGFIPPPNGGTHCFYDSLDTRNGEEEGHKDVLQKTGSVFRDSNIALTFCDVSFTWQRTGNLTTLAWHPFWTNSYKNEKYRPFDSEVIGGHKNGFSWIWIVRVLRSHIVCLICLLMRAHLFYRFSFNFCKCQNNDHFIFIWHIKLLFATTTLI